jgi:hypothetical protein
MNGRSLSWCCTSTEKGLLLTDANRGRRNRFHQNLCHSPLLLRRPQARRLVQRRVEAR